MGCNTAMRSFLVALGAAIISTGCGSDGISGPRSSGPIGTLGSGTGSDSTTSPADTTSPPPDSVTAAALALASQSPPPPPPAQPAPPGPPQPAITRQHALKKSITVTQTIGPRGGQIKIEQAGLTVVFSKGALPQNTTITVTADAGSLISYEFGPHGTQFQAPVAIEQDMQQTTIGSRTDQAKKLYGGYMPDGISDIAGDSAKVSETHQSLTSLGIDGTGKPQLKQSVFTIWHFSGYILIGARQ